MLKQLLQWFRRGSHSSAITVVEGPSGGITVVDRAMAAYLASDAPQPTQAALDSVLDRVHAVRVFQGGCYGDRLLSNELLLEVSEPTELAALRRVLTIEDGPGGHCMCYGGPTLEMLSADRARLALLGIHHGLAIRWQQWKDDATLADGRALLEWLAERGVSEPLRDFEDAETRRRQRQNAWNRWVQAMPADLSALPEATWQELTTTGDLAKVLTAAAETCPDPRERILALFKWYGSGAGPWSQYPDWERFPERLLLTFSQADLVSAASSGLLTEAQVEGAARFFAGSDFQAYSEQRDITGSLSIWYSEFDVFEPERSGGESAALPGPLLRRLWDHCQKSDDPDKRQRGDSAFRGRRDQAPENEANPG